MRQTKNATLQPGQSKFPREIITAELKVESGKKSQDYYLTVTDISKNFKDGDKLRISGEGEGLTFEGTSCCTFGMRVDPPTSTTSSILRRIDAGIGQRLLHRRHRPLQQIVDQLFELRARQLDLQVLRPGLRPR